MPRLHLFEILDQPWCPDALRRWCTEFLAFAACASGWLTPSGCLVLEGLRRTGERRVVDLCAGSSGPWASLLPTVADHVDEVVVTDLHPRPAALTAVAGVPVHVWRESVDATSVPCELSGFRVVFNAIHHFRPSAVVAVLGDAVRQRQGILTVEGTRRVPGLIVAAALLLPIAVLVLTPFVRPFSWGRLVFTYLAPVLPFVLWFDGLVSCLRTYTPEELRALAESADPEARFQWQSGLLEPDGSLPLTWLLGAPLQRAEVLHESVHL